MSQLKKLEHIQLTINSLSFGKGAGVGRHQGFVVFVAKTCPGDVVLCEITLVKKNFAEARLLEIITPGKNRRTPPCPVAFECGGCQWQQVSYERQLAEKQSLLLRTFSPLVSDPSKIAQIVASPKEFGYRNRIQVHFKNGQLGFC